MNNWKFLMTGWGVFMLAAILTPSGNLSLIYNLIALVLALTALIVTDWRDRQG